MEKAPEPSHARVGEERIPRARWEYTILILCKILIYANAGSRAAESDATARRSRPVTPNTD
jgi:hypothetical protein